MGKDAGNNFTKREKLFPASFLLYAALTLVMAYPYSLHPAAGVLTIGTDTDLYIWALGWDVHAFLHHPFSIFDANIFFPFKHTLAYSENLYWGARSSPRRSSGSPATRCSRSTSSRCSRSR